MRKLAHVLFTATLLGIGIAGDAAAGPVLDSAREPANYHPYDAAVRGDPEAQLDLARRHAGGEGVARSDGYAFQWSWRAAEQGNAEAQLMLSDIFANGIGVPKDNVTAYKWAALARANARTKGTTESATRTIESLTRQMSAAEIDAGRARVARWRQHPELGQPTTSAPEAAGRRGGMVLAAAGSTPAEGLPAKPAAPGIRPGTNPAAAGGAFHRALLHGRQPPRLPDADEQAGQRMQSSRGFSRLLRLARRLGF